MTYVPELPHGCNSWIIVRKGTLEAVGEFYDPLAVEALNKDHFEPLTALDYLQKHNAAVRIADAAQTGS